MEAPTNAGRQASKWTEEEKQSLILQYITQVMDTVPKYEDIKIPGRSDKAIYHTWKVIQGKAIEHKKSLFPDWSPDPTSPNPSKKRGWKAKAGDDDEGEGMPAKKQRLKAPRNNKEPPNPEAIKEKRPKQATSDSKKSVKCDIEEESMAVGEEDLQDEHILLPTTA